MCSFPFYSHLTETLLKEQQCPCKMWHPVGERRTEVSLKSCNIKKVLSVLSQAALVMHFKPYFAVEALIKDHDVRKEHSPPFLTVNHLTSFLINVLTLSDS